MLYEGELEVVWVVGGVAKVDENQGGNKGVWLCDVVSRGLVV